MITTRLTHCFSPSLPTHAVGDLCVDDLGILRTPRHPATQEAASSPTQPGPALWEDRSPDWAVTVKAGHPSPASKQYQRTDSCCTTPLHRLDPIRRSPHDRHTIFLLWNSCGDHTTPLSWKKHLPWRNLFVYRCGRRNICVTVWDSVGPLVNRKKADDRLHTGRDEGRKRVVKIGKDVNQPICSPNRCRSNASRSFASYSMTDGMLE